MNKEEREIVYNEVLLEKAILLFQTKHDLTPNGRKWMN
jgi:hypothetical protein